MRFSHLFATLAMSAVAFGQGGPVAREDGFFQIGYAANLNIGDSVVNLTNSGWNAGFFPNTLGVGNICVNTYIFDPREEEIGCCACLVTPNGLNSLSAKADLISDNLTPDVPTSIVIKLVASTPTAAAGGALTVCNPATVTTSTTGMIAWGSTLEPAGSPGTYTAVNVPFRNAGLSTGAGSELTALTSVCNFIQSNGSGFGICRSCRLGALGGAKQ